MGKKKKKKERKKVQNQRRGCGGGGSTHEPVRSQDPLLSSGKPGVANARRHFPSLSFRSISKYNRFENHLDNLDLALILLKLNI